MQERTESRGFYEMLWDCEYCEAKGLLGKSQRYCAQCGGKQNPDKRYFPKEGEAVRVDGHKYEGVDRTCPACSAPQSAAAHNCTHCGAPLDEAAEVRGIMTAAAPPKPRRWWILGVVLASIALVIVAIWYFFIRTTDATVTVTQHRWERAIAIEEFAERTEHGWRDQVPADAQLGICHRKQRSTKKVEDGETCTDEKVDRKDGTYEVVRKCRPKYRSEPVDDDWCAYRIRRWFPLDAVKASGIGMAPAWPAQGVPAAGAPQALGARRPGARTETLILDLGKQHCAVKEPVWRKYADGAKAKVEVRARSGKIVCDSL